MEGTCEEFRDDYALPYLDDLIVFSGSFKDHVEHLRTVLRKVKERGLKLKIDKCKFFQPQVKFLGRIVSKDGYRMDDSNVQAVKALADHIPKNVGEVRQLLGLLSFHRRYVQDFAKIARPLTDLLLDPTKEKPGTDPKKSTEKKSLKDTGKGSVPSKTAVVWTEEHREALQKLITFISNPPILAYPDPNEEYFLHVDASSNGLGGILYQNQEGKVRVIGYASRSLKPAEKNYHSTKLEFLALRWCVTEHFRDYLLGADHFKIFTDNNPLLYCMESSKLNAHGQRWVSELSEYNFSIHYRPGVINRDADCLSRLPLDIDKYQSLCTEESTLDAFQALVAGLKVQRNNDESWKAQIAGVNVEHVQNLNVFDDVSGLMDINIYEKQQADDAIRMVVDVIRGVKKPNDQQLKGNTTANLLVQQRRRLELDEDGILWRRSGNLVQLVLPESQKPLIYDHLHKQLGHLGVDKVFQLARKRVYWPKMYTDIEEFIQNKCRCLMQRRPPHQHRKAPLQSILTSSPMELVAIDFVHLEKSSGNHEYLLVIIDHFTRYSQAYPTTNKSAKTAAKFLFNDFMLRYGIPSKIMHDQGGEFENRLFAELRKLSGVLKARTTPYHPQTNGAVA